MEKKMIVEAIQQTSGVKRLASQMLGITERVLRYKLQTYGLQT